MSSRMEAIVAGEALELLAERAVYWQRRRTLIVADVHWGKDEAFRASAIPIPGGILCADLLRLGRLINELQAERLLILGDLWHDRTGRSQSLLDEIGLWRQSLKELTIALVRGNHDGQMGSVHECLNIDICDEGSIEPPFELRHYPQSSSGGYVLAGHVHPAVTLRGDGKQKLRLPCFWFGESVGVLPSFGRFTGSGDVTPRTGDRVFVVADGEIVAVC